MLKRILLQFVMGKYKWPITILTAVWGVLICGWLLVNFKEWLFCIGIIIICGICIGAIWNANYAWPLGPSVNESSNNSYIFARWVAILGMYFALVYLSIEAILDPSKISF